MKKLTEIMICTSLILSFAFIFSTVLMLMLIVNDAVFGNGTVQVFLTLYLSLIILVVSAWLLSVLLMFSVVRKERLDGKWNNDR